MASSLLACLAPLVLAVSAQEPASLAAPFPPSTALAEGVSPDALAGLSEVVQGLVDDEQIVGAELLVIKNGRSILHRAYGWSDREEERPMETGSVFCVRSMTKPLTGAAVLMLVDDDVIELDDPISKHLVSFDVDGKREITVEQLLTHTSGMPMSQLIATNLYELDGIQAVADLGAGVELEFEPGTDFNYSDQGTDTLTALVDAVSGMTAEEFLQTRVLDPLGMRESACVLTADDPLREHGVSKYAGAPGSWTRYWSPADKAIFPFFLGSQSLYSTLEDYARFLELWTRKGRSRTERLLASRLVRKALKPGPHPMSASTTLPGMSAEYGYLMQLWVRAGEDGDRDEVVAFGHTGSDGTHAWAFPEEKAMVLYFTQSRGTTTGLYVEEALGELFFGVPFDANQAAPPFEDYLGYYRDGEDDVYRTIVRDGDDLAMEVPSKAVVPLTYMGEDRWRLRPDPSKVLAFERDDAGEVTGYTIGDHREYRFEPAADLPSVDDVSELVARTHRIDLLESVGPVRIHYDLEIEKFGISGEMTTLLAWPNQWRIDEVTAEESGTTSFDGERLWQSSQAEPAKVLEGEAAALQLSDNPFARFGDWRSQYPKLTVIQRVAERNQKALVVRAGDTSAPATTLYVEEETGLLRRLDGLTFIEPMGRIGRSMSFFEFQDVSGMQLPSRTTLEFMNPMVGRIPVKLNVTSVELDVQLDGGEFVLGE